LLGGSMSYADRVEKRKVAGTLGVGKDLRLRCQCRIEQQL
jgi:ferredoxin